MLISPVVDRFIIPQHWTPAQNHPWSIHPEIDPLWSMECLDVESDALTARTRKVQYLATSPIALRYLRVCWDGRCIGYNCGKCPKCVRTQIALRIFRAEVPPGHFLQPLNLRAIAFTVYMTDEERMWYREMLEALREQPYSDPPLEDALVAAIENRYYRGLWKVARQTVWKLKSLRKAS
jgi:hypothetical protein